MPPCFGLVLLKPHANGRNIVGQQLPTLLDIICCVLYMLLEVVAQSLKPVKRLSTCKRTQQLSTCWEFLNINSGKRRKSGRDMAVLKFSFFLFFIPAEPVSWLDVLRSFRNTKQSPLHILRTFWSDQRGQERLWETGICLQKTWVSLS